MDLVDLGNCQQTKPPDTIHLSDEHMMHLIKSGEYLVMSGTSVWKHKLSVDHSMCWKGSKTDSKSFPCSHRRKCVWWLPIQNYQIQNKIKTYHAIAWNERTNLKWKIWKQKNEMLLMHMYNFYSRTLNTVIYKKFV